jgi:DNA-directed RNA polymerase sigma subunit (sigma70/sigma32)
MDHNTLINWFLTNTKTPRWGFLKTPGRNQIVYQFCLKDPDEADSITNLSIAHGTHMFLKSNPIPTTQEQYNHYRNYLNNTIANQLQNCIRPAKHNKSRDIYETDIVATPNYTHQDDIMPYLNQLSETQRQIVTAFYGIGITSSGLDEIAAVHHTTAQRIAAILQSAITQMKQFAREDVL